jgi:para-aminobenzoate synthetase/4-amino-4-deoxychorismate lyase
VFNVPIRTVILQNNAGEMGVGSGVVYDSEPQQEYKECELKAYFLIEKAEEFSLIETMLWQDGFQRLPLHLQRLAESAHYFGFSLDIDAIQLKLADLEQSFQTGKNMKVRLLLHRDGHFEIESSEIKKVIHECKLRVSNIRMSSRDRFLFHKCTRRETYIREHENAVKHGFHDVLFMNEKSELTEGAISNLFVLKNGIYCTPPVECGLLNGTFRQEFLTENRDAVEKRLYLTDLYSADEIYISNSVRGMIHVIDFEVQG